MRQRGRPNKFAAELNVVEGDFADKRPSPPDILSEWSKMLWLRVVRDEPAEFFATEATQNMLADYCRDRELIELVRKQLAEIADNKDKRRTFWDLSKTLSTLTRDVVLLATKLRITNRSRYDRVTAATASRNTLKSTKPWQL